MHPTSYAHHLIKCTIPLVPNVSAVPIIIPSAYRLSLCNHVWRKLRHGQFDVLMKSEDNPPQYSSRNPVPAGLIHVNPALIASLRVCPRGGRVTVWDHTAGNGISNQGINHCLHSVDIYHPKKIPFLIIVYIQLTFIIRKNPIFLQLARSNFVR